MPDLDKDATIKDKLKHHGRILGYKIVVAFGMQFFIAKMDSNTLSIMVFCFTNVFYMQNAWQMWVGLVLVVIIIVYYIFYMWIVWRFARDLAQKVKVPTFRRKKAEKSTSKLRTDSIQDSYKCDNLRFGSVGKMYSEYRNDISVIEMCYPIATAIRSALIAFWIVILIKFEFATPILIAITEVGYLVFTLYAQVRSERLENIVDVFKSVARVFYCVLACISLSKSVLLQTLDIIMFLTLLSITFLNIFFATYIVLLVVYDTLVDSFCIHSHHEDRFRLAERGINNRLACDFLQYRKQVMSIINTHPEIITKKTMPAMRRNEKWRPIMDEEEKIFKEELTRKQRLKNITRERIMPPMANIDDKSTPQQARHFNNEEQDEYYAPDTNRHQVLDGDPSPSR